MNITVYASIYSDKISKNPYDFINEAISYEHIFSFEKWLDNHFGTPLAMYNHFVNSYKVEKMNVTQIITELRDGYDHYVKQEMQYLFELHSEFWCDVIEV